MEAIRKKKVRRTEKQIIIDLPENFKAEEVDVILWASQDELADVKTDDASLRKWRENLSQYYSNLNVDLSNLKFNRDELYDRW